MNERLDQFYTKPEIAKKCIETVLERFSDLNKNSILFVEPSAGSGAFYYPLVKQGCAVRAIDIDPKAKEIQKGDFFKSPKLFNGDYEYRIVIGNPPFGKNSSNAVKFFNFASKYADEIAFIVPKTFRKLSVQKRLHKHFHLELDENVETDSFIFEDRPYDVPCTWQIWKKLDYEREIPSNTSVDHLLTYTDQHEADFAIRRVGFYAGRVIKNGINELSPTTHYFVRENRKGVMDIISDTEWTSLTEQTAGSRSLAKSEISKVLEQEYNGW